MNLTTTNETWTDDGGSGTGGGGGGDDADLAVQFFIEGVSIPVVGIFGFFGNLVAIKVLSSTELEMMKSIRHLLKLLAGFDAVFLAFTMTLFCPAAWSDFYYTYCK